MESGGLVFGYWVRDPERYGVVEFDEAKNVISIEEKPARPKSNYLPERRVALRYPEAPVRERKP
jgi:dTDP-glucose pyrophosphorylase